MKNKKTITRITVAGAIAALYTVLTVLLAPISFGVMQLRVAETMTILPVLMPESIIGLTIGCMISNAIGVATGANICGALDIVVGSAATLIAALLARLLRKVKIFGLPVLSALMASIFNGIFIGAELASVTGMKFWYCALSVGVEELIVSFVLGLPLYAVLNRTLFKGKDGALSETEQQ